MRMKTQSKYQYQPAEVSGHEIRYHWGVVSFNVDDDPDLHWSAEECLCLVSDSTEVKREKLQAEGCPQDIINNLLGEQQ